jgi:hypothetical protein
MHPRLRPRLVPVLVVPVPVPVPVLGPVPDSEPPRWQGHNRVALAQVDLYTGIKMGHYPFSSSLGFLSKPTLPSHLTPLPNYFTPPLKGSYYTLKCTS